MSEKLFSKLKEYLGIECKNQESKSITLTMKDYEDDAVICKINDTFYQVLGFKSSLVAFYSSDDDVFAGKINSNSLFNELDYNISFRISNEIDIRFEKNFDDGPYHSIVRRIIVNDKNMFFSYNNLGMKNGAEKMFLSIKKNTTNYSVTTHLENIVIDSENIYAEGKINLEEDTKECDYEEAMKIINENYRLISLIFDFMNLVEELSPVLRKKLIESYSWIKVFVDDNAFSAIDNDTLRRKLKKLTKNC